MQHRGCNFPNSVLQTHNNCAGLKLGADVKKRAPVKFGLGSVTTLMEVKKEKCAVYYSRCVELMLLSTSQPVWTKLQEILSWNIHKIA